MKLNYWLIPAQILHMDRILRYIKFNNMIAIICCFIHSYDQVCIIYGLVTKTEHTATEQWRDCPLFFLAVYAFDCL